MPIRKSVFETNSSSTHSIGLDSGDFKISDKPFDIGGILNIYPGEFGWEEEKYNDIWTKASYALTWAIESPKYTTMLREVIEKVTKCKVNFIPISPPDDWGYIDHQSFDVCTQVFKNKKTLTNFLFNPKSVLRTDNDNH